MVGKFRNADINFSRVLNVNDQLTSLPHHEDECSNIALLFMSVRLFWCHNLCEEEISLRPLRKRRKTKCSHKGSPPALHKPIPSLGVGPLCPSGSAELERNEEEEDKAETWREAE